MYDTPLHIASRQRLLEAAHDCRHILIEAWVQREPIAPEIQTAFANALGALSGLIEAIHRRNANPTDPKPLG
jgi:hypothetical protein